MDPMDWREPVERLRRAFQGSGRECLAGAQARFEAWLAMGGMPMPGCPGFDGAALARAYDELAGILVDARAGAAQVQSWRLRSEHLGALPKRAARWEFSQETDAPTGILMGPLGRMGTTAQAEALWAAAREVFDRSGAAALWLPALGEADSSRAACLRALSGLGALERAGVDPATGFRGASLCLDAPWVAPFGQADSALAARWAVESHGRGMARLWAQLVDARMGARLREPSGWASMAPRALRPNPLAGVAAAAMRLPDGALPHAWRAGPRQAWEMALGRAVDGPDWTDRVLEALPLCKGSPAAARLAAKAARAAVDAGGAAAVSSQVARVTGT